MRDRQRRARWQRRRYQARRAAQTCAICHADTNGSVRCARCASRLADRRLLRWCAGLCRNCGKTIQVSMRRRWHHCADCLLKRRVKDRDHPKANRVGAMLVAERFWNIAHE